MILVGTFWLIWRTILQVSRCALRKKKIIILFVIRLENTIRPILRKRKDMHKLKKLYSKKKNVFDSASIIILIIIICYYYYRMIKKKTLCRINFPFFFYFIYFRDSAKRDHIVSVTLPHSYPQTAPVCTADLPQQPTLSWKAGKSSLLDVLAQYQQVFALLFSCC